jgi:hypothetical protein
MQLTLSVYWLSSHTEAEALIGVTSISAKRRLLPTPYSRQPSVPAFHVGPNARIFRRNRWHRRSHAARAVTVRDVQPPPCPSRVLVPTRIHMQVPALRSSVAAAVTGLERTCVTSWHLRGRSESACGVHR